MARLSYPRSDGARPAALPPGERTVGQLVAESIRIYGDNFLRALPVGIPIAGLGLVTTQVGAPWTYVLAPLLTGVLVGVSYAYAVTIVHGLRPSRRRFALAWLVGVLVFVPVPFLVLGFVLPGLAWIAAFGLAVPALLVEELGFRRSFARGWQLARADYVHALGALATLAIVVFLTQAVLVFLLHGAADQATEAAFVLANVVLSPLIFLGLSLLYVDQRARVE